MRGEPARDRLPTAPDPDADRLSIESMADPQTTPRQLAGKSALVTGAGSGIGRATALLFAAEGAHVAVADRNDDAARSAVATISDRGGEATALSLDVTSEAEWGRAMEEVLARRGRLDVLVNNAGVASAGPIESLSLAEWRRVMSVNLEGAVLGTQHAIRTMKAGGSIVNVASAAGVKAIPGNSLYGTSKAALRFFTRVAALECAPRQIRVNSISPGAVATPMWEAADWWPAFSAEKGGGSAAVEALVREKGMADPAEIARAILFLVSDESRSITGTDLAIDGGFSAG